MKEANRAPFYAAVYPGLCDIARKHGYCLAIHGSVLTDLDIVAVPWTDEAGDPEVMVQAIKNHIGVLFYPDLLRRTVSEENTQSILKHQQYEGEPKAKPHGRKAYSLHFEAGAYIDLSVMPRADAALKGQPAPTCRCGSQMYRDGDLWQCGNENCRDYREVAK